MPDTLFTVSVAPAPELLTVTVAVLFIDGAVIAPLEIVPILVRFLEVSITVVEPT